MRYYLLGLAAAALTVPQALLAQTQDRSGLSIFPQSPSLEQPFPSSTPPSVVFDQAFDQAYEYVGEVEYFDDPVTIDRRRFSTSYPTIRRFPSVPYSYRYQRSPRVIIKFGSSYPSRPFYSQPFRRSYNSYNNFRYRFYH